MDVVISGIGGRFPGSKNVQEFSENLLTGKSLLETVTRWPAGTLNTPLLAGQTADVDKFDHMFFGVHYDLSKMSAPDTRKAVETAFEALVDAGVSPTSIRGTNAQVYSGCSQQEDDCFLESASTEKRTGYMIMGRNRCLAANRISYILNLTGRSSAIDSSSTWLGTGLAMARNAIQSGECDTVFLSGTSVMTIPEICKQKQNMGLVSTDNSCRPFDEDVKGVLKGDAQVTFLIQRADIAKRSYGSIVLAHSAPLLYQPNWFLSINEEYFRNYIDSLYSKNGVDPSKVQVLEADGLCVKDMVEVELNVFDKIFNYKRTKDFPLKLGTVKTVIGDTEAAAGHAALTKLILAMETGIISPTLNCRNPNPNIPGLIEGRYKVVTEPTKWEVTGETHVALSTLSTNGLVSHVVLRANGKAKDTNFSNDFPLPYLILMCGRNEKVVERSLKIVASSSFDPEYLRLTHEVFACSIDKYEWKGFGFHGQDTSENFFIQRENRRPVWYLFSGMGSQWAGMGKGLLSFPIIRETIERLHKILEPKDIDLFNILTTSDAEIFDNILHSFVGIASVQIALTNLLKQLGIEPDGLIGHSVGELGCSYADGCLTEEQVILAAYERGMASFKADLIPGLMAAVGLGYEQVKDRLPSDVFVACRNSKDNCTISGPAESVKKVIKLFKDDGIFVRGVNVANIAYHSPYIRPAAPLLYDSLRKIIPSPKLRSSKWVCTSAPKEKWNTDEVRYCSADFHTNNLLNPVLFEEGSADIPKDALVIEIAPHGLLQAIVKRSLGGEVANVPLTRRGADSSAVVLLQAIGKLYLEGLSPKIWHLYPEVQFPVSRNTPSLAPLIGWDYNLFPLSNEDNAVNRYDAICQFDSSCPNLKIAGVKSLLPSFALEKVWKRFADVKGKKMNGLKVIFEDISFINEFIELDNEDTADVSVNILLATGQFVVTSKEITIIKGKIRTGDEESFAPIKLPQVSGKIDQCLDSDDIYSELENRGIVLPDNLKNIHRLQLHSQDWIADINFDGEWHSLLNSLFTLFQLISGANDQKPSRISHINQLIIDPLKINSNNITTRLHLLSSILTMQGISLSGVEFKPVEIHSTSAEPVSLQFVPFGKTGLEDSQFLWHVAQLSLDKNLVKTSVFKIYDFDGALKDLTGNLCDVVRRKNGTQCDIVNTASDANILLCGPESILSIASLVADSKGLLITRCDRDNRNYLESCLGNVALTIVAESHSNKMSSRSLLAITNVLPAVKPSDINIIKMAPLDHIPLPLDVPSVGLTICVWENGTYQPIEEFLDAIISQEHAENIRLVILMTPNSPLFSLNLPLYANQLRLNLPVNVYFDSQWGTYRLIQTSSPIRTDQNGGKNDLVIIQNELNSSLTLDIRSLKIHRTDKCRQSSVETVGFCYGCDNSNRIMGVGVVDNDSESFSPDSKLFWTVPEDWSVGEASRVPLQYAIAFYILLEVAQIQVKEKLLVTCPLTPVGQAVIRIAVSLGCGVVVMVTSREEIHEIKRILPKIKENQIVLSSTGSFTCLLRTRYPEGFGVIVSDLAGSRLRAATWCLRGFGRLVQIGEDPMHLRDHIGTQFFLNAATVYGVTEQTLVNAPSDVKVKVVTWVQKGLDSKILRPDELQFMMPSRMSNGVTNAKIIRVQALTPVDEGGDSPNIIKQKTVRKCEQSSIIVGGSSAQWVRLAYSLARKGRKNIKLFHDTPSSNLVARHSKILYREFGTKLGELKSITSAADLCKNNSDVRNIASVFVFEHNRFSEDFVSSLDEGAMRDIPITFFSKTSTHFSRMCERWARKGLKVRAALGIEDVPIAEAKTFLDWMWSPTSPTVSVFDKSKYLSRKETISLAEARLLPTSATDLEVLGSSIRENNSPGFRELTTRSPHRTEVNPLFFIKGIYKTATAELEGLASNLFARFVEVTLNADCGSLEATALSVVKGIRKIQSRGPYNLAGATLRSDVVMEVARILETMGFASVVFLMDQGLEGIREVVASYQEGNKLGVYLLKTCLVDNTIEHDDWSRKVWDSVPWLEQAEAAVSALSPLRHGEQRKNVMAALNHVYESVKHIIEGRHKTPTVDHGIVHLLRKGKVYGENKLREQLISHTIPSLNLSDKQTSDVFSANLATPVLQLNMSRAIRSKRSDKNITNIIKF